MGRFPYIRITGNDNGRVSCPGDLLDEITAGAKYLSVPPCMEEDGYKDPSLEFCINSGLLRCNSSAMPPI